MLTVLQIYFEGLKLATTNEHNCQKPSLYAVCSPDLIENFFQFHMLSSQFSKVPRCRSPISIYLGSSGVTQGSVWQKDRRRRNAGTFHKIPCEFFPPLTKWGYIMKTSPCLGAAGHEISAAHRGPPEKGTSQFPLQTIYRNLIVRLVTIKGATDQGLIVGSE